LAIDINWATKVISVFKVDMDLIQSVPTEIYELDLNVFRLILRDMEDGEEGIPYLPTHSHNTEVDLGGITYARVIEIINDYTVTFEDGQYAVNLFGANSNVGDRVNVNQVSVRSANSAGLISSKGIRAIEYRGGVTIDVTTTSIGTKYPIGTLREPVDNLTDAIIIAEREGFKKIYVLESMTLDDGTDISDYVIEGRSHVNTNIVIHDNAICDDITIKNCNVSGTLDGGTHIVGCSVGSLNYVNGHIHGSGLYGTLILGGNEKCVIADSYTIDQDNPLIVDMGGSGQSLSMPNYSGIVTVTNLSDADQEVGIGLNAGLVILTDTITAGTIIIAGVGILMNGADGVNINTDGLINKETITKATWDTVYVNTITGSSGTVFPKGTISDPVNNLTDAKTIADNNGIERFRCNGEATLQEAFSEYIFTSNSPTHFTLHLNGQDITDTMFNSITFDGICSGHFDAVDCTMESGLTNVDASLEGCLIGGTYTVAAGIMLTGINCSTTTSCIINLNDTGSVGFTNYSGIIVVANATNPACFVGIVGNYLLTLDVSCTSGQAYVAGIGILVNNSTLNLTERTLPSSVWEEYTTSHTTSGTYGNEFQTIADGIVRLLGLNQENYIMDTITYNGELMTGAKLRLYDDNTLTNQTDSYTVSVVYNGNNISSYTSVKD